jgi:hypothetical protein
MSWPGQHDQSWGRPGGYGDDSPYQAPVQGPAMPGGFGGPPSSPSSGCAGGALAIVLVVLAVVVLVVGVGGVLLLTADDRPDEPPPATAPAPTAPQTTPESSLPAVATTSPVLPGRVGVASYKHGLAYDVPRTWKVETPDTIVGFEDPKGNPLAVMSGAAGIERGDCSLVRTGARGGVTPDVRRSARLSDLPGVARSEARRWANAGYTPTIGDTSGQAPTVQLSRPRGVKLRGGIRGYYVTAQVTVNGTRGTCDPPRAVVHVVAFPSTRGEPVVFIGYADVGVPGAPGDTDIRKAISSIRPLR